MAWIQHLLVWLFVMSTSALKCKHCFEDQIYENPPIEKQVVSRSAQQEQLRTNERSLPIYSETQRIQDEERIRYNVKVDEVRNRVDNGTYKILNNPAKPFINKRSLIDTPGDRIVFPGPTVDSLFEPDIPDECKKIGICDKIPNYPEEHVSNIISKLGDKQYMFHIDGMGKSDTPDIAQRVGPPEENIELCNFREEIYFPQAALDSKGMWHTVINPINNPVQGFKVEICGASQSGCAEFLKFHPGYDGRCVQKYMYRPMITYIKENRTAIRQLSVPSCCSCVAKVTNF